MFVLPPVPLPAAPAGCDVVIAPGDPLEARVRAASPGQTICLRGTVRGLAWISADGVTLRSAPGGRATLRGQVVVDAAASHVTVRDLAVDGKGQAWPTPTIYGSYATFANDDVTNERTDICFQIGPGGEHQRGTVRGTRLIGNRIHDCGHSTNHQHAVYVADAIDTRIVGNEIVDNGDRGLQLYPAARRTTVTGNVLDGNGENITISGRGGTRHKTTGTRVRFNVMTNPRVRASVESSWIGTRPGRDNLVEQNCIWGGRETIDAWQGGFTARDNLIAPVAYADRAAGDFRLPAGSPCAVLLAAGRGDAAARAAVREWRPAAGARARAARSAGSSR